MRLLNPTAPVRRILSGLLAMVLAFTSINVARGVFYGVVNPTFSPNGQCSTNGWTTTGDVKLVPSPLTPGDCAVVLAASARRADQQSASEISQTFLVDLANPQLKFYLRPSSNNPNSAFAAQTVTIYGPAGQIIYKASRNTQIVTGAQSFVVDVDLNAYANQQVRLSVAVAADSSQPASPSHVELLFDFDLMEIVDGPEVTPGPGW